MGGAGQGTRQCSVNREALFLTLIPYPFTYHSSFPQFTISTSTSFKFESILQKYIGT